ncbi:MAG: translation elongation factor Ts [Dehalococcoidia bacterium]|tara:strand:+ start:367 stop:837 length:471 start_codon:yes stop_codon:yes gene_type:complete
MSNTESIKLLRSETGAGVMDAKRALEEANDDFEKAKDILKEKGIADAEKRASRATGQGVIESYIHQGNRLGAIIEINCETDFVARTSEFKNLAKNLAMQVAAMDPASIDNDNDSLMEQQYIKDSDKLIKELVQEVIAQTGENIKIKRFQRFEVGGE